MLVGHRQVLQLFYSSACNTHVAIRGRFEWIVQAFDSEQTQRRRYWSNLQVLKQPLQYSQASLIAAFRALENKICKGSKLRDFSSSLDWLLEPTASFRRISPDICGRNTGGIIFRRPQSLQNTFLIQKTLVPLHFSVWKSPMHPQFVLSRATIRFTNQCHSLPLQRHDGVEYILP